MSRGQLHRPAGTMEEVATLSFRRMIQAVETHSGEPMRVITGGVPSIPGSSVYEQMKWLEQNDDQLDLVPEGGRDITRVGL